MRPRAVLILIAAMVVAGPAYGQLGLFSPEQRIEFTRKWTGQRFPDGRPMAPDSVLERMRTVSAEEAWGVLRKHHYLPQFEGDWKQFNATGGKRLVGRAVTAVFMPVRPDVNEVIVDHAKREGRVGAGQQSWVIDTLVPGDVFVADLYGKVIMIGDNLATSIFAKSKNGVVIHGGIRDLSGIQGIKEFQGYYRFHDPGIFENAMLMGINVPIRIGNTTIMPGDVVLGDPEGVVFVPPHLADEVVTTAEDIHDRDEWGHQMLREGKYTPGQIDTRWSKEMEEDFERWRKAKQSQQR
jgi:4-hydroxy-4-methyl-2-oxoglutarate aldolase